VTGIPFSRFAYCDTNLLTPPPWIDGCLDARRSRDGNLLVGTESAMTQVTFAAGVALVCSIVAAPVWREPAGSPAQQPDRTIFFDDFTTRELDRSRWTPEVWGHTVNNEQQAYIDALTSSRLSAAMPRREPGQRARDRRTTAPASSAAATGRTFDFVSGRLIAQEVRFTYGTAAARMRLPAGAGLWPAFWLLGTGKWPDTGEIDVMENVGDPAWVSVALHGPGYSGDTPLVSRFHFPAGQDATLWHVYSVDWSRDAIQFRVDDAMIYRVSRATVESTAGGRTTPKC
jgi:hypothetical protein